MPVKLTNDQWLYPTSQWQKTKSGEKDINKIEVDPNFYIKVEK